MTSIRQQPSTVDAIDLDAIRSLSPSSPSTVDAKEKSKSSKCRVPAMLQCRLLKQFLPRPVRYQMPHSLVLTPFSSWEEVFRRHMPIPLRTSSLGAMLPLKCSFAVVNCWPRREERKKTKLRLFSPFLLEQRTCPSCSLPMVCPFGNQLQVRRISWISTPRNRYRRPRYLSRPPATTQSAMPTLPELPLPMCWDGIEY